MFWPLIIFVSPSIEVGIEPDIDAYLRQWHFDPFQMRTHFLLETKEFRQSFVLQIELTWIDRIKS